jgi:hypothetical protein
VISGWRIKRRLIGRLSRKVLWDISFLPSKLLAQDLLTGNAALPDCVPAGPGEDVK